MDRRDEIIRLQMDVINQMTRNNLNRIADDLWGVPSAPQVPSPSAETTDVPASPAGKAEEEKKVQQTPAATEQVEEEPPENIEDLKKEGLWFVCAAMDGEVMYRCNLTGPIGLVIGNEGEGVGRLVREKCDFTASIPMKGDIDSLNASVAAGVMAFEIVRQRMNVQK